LPGEWLTADVYSNLHQKPGEGKEMSERYEAPQHTEETSGSQAVSLKMLSEAMGEIDPKLNTCINQARKRDDTTTERAEAPCYQTAMKEWDSFLNTSYQYLMKDLSSWKDPATKNQVVEAERQWIKSRDEQFKAIEDWELASNMAQGSIPEDRSIMGLDQKVDIVRKQAEAVFGMKADLTDPYDWDKPL
jgi:uncharacterized protein YecT (DUF1311 family)